MSKKRKLDKWAGFKFGTVRKVEGLSSEERDRRFKNAYIILWRAWCANNGMCGVKAMDNYYATGPVDLAHLKGKNAFPELRYSFLNVQLITHEAHMLEHETGKQIDFRPVEFVKWLKELDFTI